MKKIKAFVLSHGHMDIEWYQPLRSYRFWQVEALDRLLALNLADEDTLPYTLDGQVYPVEEYLALRPEKAGEISALVRAGKLRIGPFYTQFDEWLPSGESMVRNCLYGDRLGAALGGVMRVGYLPDNFGHPLQLPQLLRGFGIDSLIFMRGMPYITEDFPDEFIYVGLDGSALHTVHFRYTYCGTYQPREPRYPIQRRDVPYYPGYISYEYHSEQSDLDDPQGTARLLVEGARRLALHAPSGAVAVVVGADHTPPQRGLAQAVALANTLQDEIEFISSEPEAYIAAVREAEGKPRVTQELIGSRFQYILLGALSTRSYVKRQNFACETLLTRYAEPLDALARRAFHRGWDNVLTESWKLLMMNHAHDSIHGSSVDEVHTEMEGRFLAVSQNCAGLIHDVLAYLGRRTRRWWPEEALGLLAFVPDSACMTLAQTHLPIGDGPVSLLYKDGSRLPVQVLPPAEPDDNGRGLPRTDRPLGDPVREVLLPVTGPAMSLVSCAVVPGDAPGTNPFAWGEDFIENEHLRLSADGAALRLLDKATGRTCYDLNLLVEQADAGDYWDTSPTWQPSETVLSNRFPAMARVTETGPLRATLRIAGTMSVPRALAGDRRTPERVDLPYCFDISLTSGVRRADVTLRFDNRAMDHKISLRLAPGLTAGSIRCATAFSALRRPVTIPAPGGKLVQPPTRLFPFRDWLALEDGPFGLALAAQGLYDYEPLTDPLTGETGVLLTLLRSVGNMTRLNTRMRDGAAAWSFPSDSAQCPGEQVIRFSYLPYDTDGENLPFTPAMNGYFAPAVAHMVRSQPEPGSVSLAAPFTLPEGVVLSAFKRAWDADADILRFYEPTGQARRVRVGLPGYTAARRADLNEHPGEALPLQDGAVELTVGAYEIVTLHLMQ